MQTRIQNIQSKVESSGNVSNLVWLRAYKTLVGDGTGEVEMCQAIKYLLCQFEAFRFCYEDTGEPLWDFK